MTKIKNTERFLVFLVTVDIAKAFDSLDHNVLTSTTEEIWFCLNVYLMGKHLTERSEILCY